MSKDCPEGPLPDLKGPLSSKVPSSSSIRADNLEVKPVLMDERTGTITIQNIP